MYIQPQRHHAHSNAGGAGQAVDTANPATAPAAGRFHYRSSDGGSDTMSQVSDSSAPSAHTQQVNNLVDYVVDSLCFGESAHFFGTTYKAYTSSQLSTQHVHEREQAERIEKAFGAKWQDGPPNGDAAPAAHGAGYPVRHTQPSQPVGNASGVAAVTAQAFASLSLSPDRAQTLVQAVNKLNMRKVTHERTPESIQGLQDSTLIEEKRALKQGLRNFDGLFERVTGRAPEKADKEPLRTVYAYYKELKKEITQRGATQPNMIADMDDDLPLPPQAAHRAAYSGPGSAPQQPGVGGGGDHRNGAGSANEYGTGQQQQQHFTQQRPGPLAHVQSTNFSAEEIDALRAEKKLIKRKLFDFMNRFKEQHGREVRTKEDRAPFAADYDRYRHLKNVLQAVDGAGN